jgi:hypothetical protein
VSTLHRARITVTITLALLLASCSRYSGQAYQGEAFVTLTSTEHGITWSGHVQGFRPNIANVYRWTLLQDGYAFLDDRKGGYVTDSQGAHFRLRPNDPETRLDCGPGDFEVILWVENEHGTVRSADARARLER